MALDKIQLSDLLSVYANVLTEKQRDALKMYCDCDCSLAEISLESGVSRQAVRDAIVNGEKSLIKLEESLHLSSFIAKLLSAVSDNDINLVRDVLNAYVAKE